MSLLIELKATSVGLPADLGEWQGERVVSAIRKSRVEASEVAVGATNIAGDGQADLSAHGGPDKAVYAYPADHWPWWLSTTAYAPGPAGFGENLTLFGAGEDMVKIGDRFRWGEVLLEVSQPRAPCYKLNMLTRREDMSARMTASARTGWYYRVLETGTAPTKGWIERVSSEPANASVREAFEAMFLPRVKDEIVEKVLASAALSPVWRGGVRKRRR